MKDLFCFIVDFFKFLFENKERAFTVIWGALVYSFFTIVAIWGCGGFDKKSEEKKELKKPVNSLYSGYSDPDEDDDEDGGTVYICTGSKSKRYHCDPSCRGLQSCSGDVISVSVEEAEEDWYRTPCGYCY